MKTSRASPADPTMTRALDGRLPSQTDGPLGVCGTPFLRRWCAHYVLIASASNDTDSAAATVVASVLSTTSLRLAARDRQGLCIILCAEDRPDTRTLARAVNSPAVSLCTGCLGHLMSNGAPTPAGIQNMSRASECNGLGRPHPHGH